MVQGGDIVISRYAVYGSDAHFEQSSEQVVAYGDGMAKSLGTNVGTVRAARTVVAEMAVRHEGSEGHLKTVRLS